MAIPLTRNPKNGLFQVPRTTAALSASDDAHLDDNYKAGGEAETPIEERFLASRGMLLALFR